MSSKGFGGGSFGGGFNMNQLMKQAKQMQQEIKSIYSLIFKDLDDLFYSII